MKTLYLHIGFPKTGSSALQSWLSMNANALARQGIEYANLVPSAERGEITSGNGFTLFNALKAQDMARVKELVTGIYFGSSGNETAVVSSEFLCITPKPRLLQLRELCRDNGIDVHIIAFLRSLYERGYSAYVQDVKTKGRSDALRASDIMENCRRTRRNLLKFFRVFRNSITVLNYDDTQRDVVTALAQATGMDLNGLETLNKRINRSFSRAEVSVMRELNALHDGRFSMPLSKYLLQHAPERPTQVAYEDALVDQVRAEGREDLEWINNTFSVSPPVATDLVSQHKSAEAQLADEDPQDIYDLAASWLADFKPGSADSAAFGAFIAGAVRLLQNTGTNTEVLRRLETRAEQLPVAAS